MISKKQHQIPFLKDTLLSEKNIEKEEKEEKKTVEQPKITEQKEVQQLITDQDGLKYYKELPVEWNKCSNFKEFYDLKDKGKGWKPGNTVPKTGKPYLIYSPYSHLFFYRETHEETNYLKLLKYFKDENIYVKERRN